MSPPLDSPRRLLLVDDDAGDRLLLARALEAWPRPVELIVLEDGERALDYLLGRAAGARRPDLVLLDLNLPRLAGKAVLARLRAVTTDLPPVVVLTTSRQPWDIRECRALGAASYLVKPLDARRFGEVMQVLLTYWFHTVELDDDR